MTRLGNFWKFLATNLLTKVAQKIVDFWAIKNGCGYFLGNLWKHLGNFFPSTSGHTDHVKSLHSRFFGTTWWSVSVVAGTRSNTIWTSTIRAGAKLVSKTVLCLCSLFLISKTVLCLCSLFLISKTVLCLCSLILISQTVLCLVVYFL